MNFPLTFMGMGILCLAVLVIAGCLGTGPQTSHGQTPAPTGTPVMVGHIVVNESQNGATVSVNRTAAITLKLK
jgi:hypothetical protein